MSEIQTTLGELVNAEPVLRRICELDGFSAKGRYHVCKLARLVAVETRHFAEQRAGLFTSLGVERPTATDAERRAYGPTLREIPAQKLPEFQRQLSDLASVPVTIAWGPVRSVDLPATAKPADLCDLGPLCELVEPEDEGK